MPGTVGVSEINIEAFPPAGDFRPAPDQHGGFSNDTGIPGRGLSETQGKGC